MMKLGINLLLELAFSLAEADRQHARLQLQIAQARANRPSRYKSCPPNSKEKKIDSKIDRIAKVVTNLIMEIVFALAEADRQHAQLHHQIKQARDKKALLKRNSSGANYHSM